MKNQPSGNETRPESADHPGGPLSRAERVLLSNMKRETHRARVVLAALEHIIGAVPGTQKIDLARREALRAIARMLEAFRQRKDGAPPPAGEHALWCDYDSRGPDGEVRDCDCGAAPLPEEPNSPAAGRVEELERELRGVHRKVLEEADEHVKAAAKIATVLGLATPTHGVPNVE